MAKQNKNIWVIIGIIILIAFAQQGEKKEAAIAAAYLEGEDDCNNRVAQFKAGGTGCVVDDCEVVEQPLIDCFANCNNFIQDKAGRYFYFASVSYTCDELKSLDLIAGCMAQCTPNLIDIGAPVGSDCTSSSGRTIPHESHFCDEGSVKICQDGTATIIRGCPSDSQCTSDGIGDYDTALNACEGYCEDTEWLPAPETQCEMNVFIQTSNCGNTRAAGGTLDCTIDCPDGFCFFATFHDADTNQDTVIDNSELLSYANKWLNNEVTNTQLLEAASIWING